jgi:hypothetical protein
MSHSDLEVAGRLLKEHVTASDAADARARGRARLVRSFERSSGHGHIGRTLALAAAAVLLLLPLGWWWRVSHPVAITFAVGREPGKVGAYVSPPANAAWALAFSEGSVIELGPLSRGRVTRTSPHGAEVLLETGRARVDVHHAPQTDWTIVAGPYTIRVIGTSFDVSFETRTQTLEVVMRSGSVRVEGPGIASPVEVHGSQRFVQGARAPEVVGSAAPPTGDQSAAAAPAAVSAEVPPGRPSSSPVPVASAAGSVAVASLAPASWTSLAGKGQYGAVLEQAENMGIERALSTTGAPDLMALGNAARFAGKTDLSARAYQAVRARFGGTPEAANAAFFLGRMVEGQSPNMAIGWYERYAAEAPAGAWVAEAMGRRMVLLKKSGAHEAAIDAAHQYMARFPQGPYAGVAREMTTTP